MSVRIAINPLNFLSQNGIMSKLLSNLPLIS